MRVRVLLRLMQIQRVLVRHGLDDFVRATHLYRPLRFLFYLQPSTWFQRARGGSRGERLRLALEELGPIFVKFGQALSTRRDLLPDDIADELAKLQDRVPPFPGAIARAAIERASAGRSASVFGSSIAMPLAAASIAQVHAATLNDGREVIVKVLRPGMREVIPRDLEVLYALARLATRYWPEARRLRPLEVVARIRQDHHRRARPDARGGQRVAAEAQFRRLALLYVPEVLLGLLPPRRAGHGAHPRHHRSATVARLRDARRRHSAAGRERRGDLLHPGVPRTTSSTPTCTPATFSC